MSSAATTPPAVTLATDTSVAPPAAAPTSSFATADGALGQAVDTLIQQMYTMQQAATTIQKNVATLAQGLADTFQPANPTPADTYAMFLALSQAITAALPTLKTASDAFVASQTPAAPAPAAPAAAG